MITNAKRQAKLSPDEQPQSVDEAIKLMRLARGHLRDAGAKKAADYLARALKSAEGALRHAEGMRRWPAQERAMSAHR